VQDAPATDLVPWARAVIRHGRITLNPWSPSLMSGGPARSVLARLRHAGTVIADLRSQLHDSGGEELIVEWVPAGAATAAAEAALLAWAERVGYVRIWLPDRVVDLADTLFAGGRAATTCPTCGLVWDDESADFWAMVRSQGFFPAACPVCNGSLPEWQRLDEAGWAA